LFVEDSDEDAELVLRELRRGGFDVAFERVDTSEAMGAALAERPWDLVLCDYAMPRFSAPAALALMKAALVDLPFFIVSGTIGEEAAVEAMRNGVNDYITKGHLARLVPAVQRELAYRASIAQRAARLAALADLERQALELTRPRAPSNSEAALSALFDSALEHLWMAYQPIVRRRAQEVLGYEALVRAHEVFMSTPLELLNAGERLGRLFDLGRRVRSLVARDAPEAPKDALIFVNLHPADLNDAELVSPSSPLSAIASRVVLEVTERASLARVGDLAKSIAKLRQLGFRIAIDDLGAGYADLTSFAQLEPDFAKLDMALVRGVDKLVRKQSVVRSMLSLCENELNVAVVCEGVETPGEANALAHLGSDLMQGYLFAPAGPGFPSPDW
jgi:EAL domain-containing protein (putative c-di-GMP-specific phosphodiesterase class I)/CheY-like chemotaxis protein